MAYTQHEKEIERMIERARQKNALIVQLRKALKPAYKAAKQKADFMHSSWDADAHVEMTLTISECRAIAEALKAKPHAETKWSDPEELCDADD